MTFDLGLSLVPAGMEKLLAAKTCYLYRSDGGEGLFIATKVVDPPLERCERRRFHENDDLF